MSTVDALNKEYGRRALWHAVGLGILVLIATAAIFTASLSADAGRKAPDEKKKKWIEIAAVSASIGAAFIGFTILFIYLTIKKIKEEVKAYRETHKC